MVDTEPACTGEHAQDAMLAALRFMQNGEGCALAIVTGTEGGAVRAPGAMMAIGRDGKTCGYISGGCIDADVIARAQAAMETSEIQTLRYGAGSPFVDLRLPCGGSIDLVILPRPNRDVLKNATGALNKRQSVRLSVSNNGLEVGDKEDAQAFGFTYRPKLKLRIAGRGTDPVALARVATASGIDVSLWSPDEACLGAAKCADPRALIRLDTPSNLPDANDDAETAFVLMFHDTDWEPALLESALAGDAFFIGAVGSHATQQRRCEILRARGIEEGDIQRIRGPVGLVPSMRDASMLAVSALAEIVAAYHAAEPL